MQNMRMCKKSGALIATSPSPKVMERKVRDLQEQNLVLQTVLEDAVPGFAKKFEAAMKANKAKAEKPKKKKPSAGE